MKAITIPITFFLIIIYLFQIWKKNPKILFIGSVFFIEMIWQIVSIVWIDGGAYISEELRYSYFTGASIRFLLLILPFLVFYPYFLNKELSKKKIKKLTQNNIKSKDNRIFFVIIFIIGYLLLDLIISQHVPLFMGINYTKYYSQYSRLPLASTIHSYILPFICLLLGILSGQKKRLNRSFIKYLVAFAFILIIQLLLNNKFYGLYDYVLHYVTGYFCYIIFTKAKMKKLPIKYILLTLIGVGILLYLSYNKYSKTMDNPIQYLLDRLFALQNHTFWGMDRLWQAGELSIDWSGFCDEVLYGFTKLETSRLDPNFGIARVMYYVTSNAYATNMLSTGYLFAGSYLTIIMSYIGYIPAFIGSFIMAYIVSKLSVSLYKNILSQNYFILYFVFFIYRRFFEYFRVGNIVMILNWKLLIIYLFLLAYYVLSMHRKHERRMLL